MRSDLRWAKAIVLTSPTVATVGLSLTIPFAMLSDATIGVRVAVVGRWRGFEWLRTRLPDSWAPGGAARAAGRWDCGCGVYRIRFDSRL